MGQTPNPQTVNVQDLSDQQIQQIIREIEKRGLTEGDAIAMARARGFSQTQIDQLKQRMNALGSKSGSAQSAASATIAEAKELGQTEPVLSVKKKAPLNMADSTVFGYHLFNSDKLTFEPNVNIPVPESYVLGPGDEILVDVYGSSQQSYQLAIDKNGSVAIPLLGPVQLGGLTLHAAQSRLVDQLGNLYSDLRSANPRTFASIRTGRLKTIRVNVVGEVLVPGSYTLPGTASLFNVLYLSGGPNKQGSFRDIRLIRDGKVIHHLDVYEFLIHGKTTVNVPLLDNDVVMIPTYETRIKLFGELKRNGIFEARPGEQLQTLIEYAGGYSEAAYTARMELYRNANREREMKDVTPETLASFTVANGDSLYVGKILSRFKNKISIAGAVFKPGNYEYVPGLTLAGLIEKADGVTENAFLNRGVVSRLKSDFTPENVAFSVADVVSGRFNLELKPNDAVLISAINDLREQRTVAIWGEVQHIGKYSFAEKMTLGDLVFISGGFKESASQSSIEVMRRLSYEEADANTGSTAQLFQFAISRNLTIADAGASFELMPFDEVFIRFMPGYRDKGVVAISGQVKYSGNYGLASRTERISSIIDRAGGLTPIAFLPGARLIREYKISAEDQAQREELMRKDSTVRFSELNFETVAIQLDKIMTHPGGVEDLYLEPGDVIEIPATLQTVKVSGEVLNSSSTAFIKNWSAKNYVRSSGGFALSAKKSKTYVIYPNGSAAATKGFLFFRSYPTITPGSEIVVPKRPEREGMSTQAWVGIGSAIASIGLTVATIVTINK